VRGRLLGAALVALAAATPAVGSEGSLVGIRPLAAGQSWVRTALPAGRSLHGAAVVMNLTSKPQAVRLSAADATTTADGVFTLAADGAPSRGVGAWTRPDVSRLVLAPGEQRRVGYRMRVPAGAEPGDYAGGLIVQSDRPARATRSGGVSIQIVERVGMRIYHRVPGRRDGTVAVEGLSASTVGAGGVRGLLGLADAVGVRFRVADTGNLHYDRLSGRVELLDGTRVLTARPLDLGTILPGQRRDVAVRLPLGGWSTGRYHVRVRVASAPAATAAATVSVGAERIWAAACVAGLGLLGAAVLLVRRRRRRA
jgi:hypothetical protein